VLEEFEAATLRRGAAIGTVIADLWGTLALVRAGALPAAEERGSRALAGAVEQGWLFGRAGSQLLLAEIAIERGDIRTALHLDRAIKALVALDADIDDKGWADHMLHGRALSCLAAGDAPTALARLLEVGRRHDAWLVRCPSELPWRSNAALAALLAGDRARAEALATEEVELAQDFGARRAIGIALRVHGLATGSESSLREAGEALAGSPACLELARVRCDLGTMLQAAGRVREARSFLHEAVEGAEAAGALALARRARARLRAAGGRPRITAAGRPLLSSSELRTAHLAARGLTNPEIARSLFLSRRTVETHLYNVYRKLGIASREDLDPEALVRLARP
jgi:DNA-binding CsgD family transcriptional regulator